MQHPALPIAIVIGSGFDEGQFTQAQRYLLNAEIPAKVISIDGGLIQGWYQGTWGHHFMADESLSDVLSADYQGLILIGGARGLVSLQNNPHAKRFVRAFVQAAKPVAAIGESAMLLVGAEVVTGRRLVAPEGNAAALEKAGALVAEDETHTDGMLLTAANTVETTTILDELVEMLRRADEALEAA